MPADLCGTCKGYGYLSVQTALFPGEPDEFACPDCDGTNYHPDVVLDDPWAKEVPVLPYAGTSGWSGSSTSRSRAEYLDGSGKTTERQNAAMALMRERGPVGVTWRDLADHLHIHHGSASGVLSVLHKRELICRLKESRERCKVYVLPEFVEYRDTELPGRVKAACCPNCGTSLGGAA